MFFFTTVLYKSTAVDYIFKSIYFTDLYFFYTYLLISATLVTILILINYLLSNTFWDNNHKYTNSSYECGFEPFNTNMDSKFSLYYFRVSLFFLIFDLEILYVYPWVSVSKFFLLSKFFIFFFSFFPIIFILFLGLIYEYSLSLYDWF